MAQQVNKVMTKSVVSVSSKQTLQEAASLMKRHNIGVIPVIDNNKLVGILTDRDIAIRSTAVGRESDTPVYECMSSHVTVATSDMDVHEVANIMSEYQIRRLPVVEGDEVVGMVALGDLAEQEIYQNEAGDALSSISSPSHPDQLN